MEGKVGLDEKLDKHSNKPLPIEAADEGIRSFLLLWLLWIELEDGSYRLLSARDTLIAQLSFTHLLALWGPNPMVSP